MNRHALRTSSALVITTGVCLALMVGCSNKPPVAAVPSAQPAPESATVTTTANVAATPAATATAGPVSLSHLKLGLRLKWKGLTRPVYLTNAGDGSGRIFIVEQGGLVKVVENGALQSRPFLDLRAKTAAGGERGLLGMAFSPDYVSDGKIYVDYTDTSGNTVIARYTTTTPASSTPSWSAPRRLLYIKQPYANHNGGCLQFGPDGYLYIGMGDGGSGGDPGNRAQSKTNLLGKILRIDVSRAGATKPYLIPATNPWKLTTNTALKPAPEVWALGVRNPWRFSFDAKGGTLWVGDVGQNAYEEVDCISRTKASSYMTKGGLNLGWRTYEGLHYYPSGTLVPKTSRSTKYIWPTYDYRHPTGESITGGYVYRGQDYPALVGTYLFADYVNGWIAGIRLRAPDGTILPVREVRRLLETPYNPSSFGVDERGELYLVNHAGSVHKVVGIAQ